MSFLKRLLRLLQPYKAQVILTVLVLCAFTAVDMAFPAIIRQVIDQGLAGGKAQTVVLYAGLVAALGLLKAVLAFANRYQAEKISHSVAYDLRNRLYDHIQHLSFSFHDRSQSGQLISRCIEDVRSLRDFSGHGIIELSRAVLLLVGIIAILFSTNPRLAVITLLPIIPLTIMTSRFGTRLNALFLKVDNTLGDLSTRLQENVIGVQVVRAFTRERYEEERFDATNRQLFGQQITVLKEWSKIMPSTTFLITLGTILILWVGGQMVLAGQLTVGELVEFNGYMLLLAMPAQQLSWLVNSASEASAGLQRVYDILDLVPEIKSPPGAVSLATMQGAVYFDRVSFAYHGEKGEALHDVHLEVAPNQIVALIGPTGSGKTTLVNLIPRFYDVTKGSLRIDGVDIRQMDLRSLRNQIGIVLQSSLLFSATVRENLAFGRPDADEADIIAAARAAQAHDFILELPHGYDTEIGERGVTLSGGQRQRIAIGRAILMNPRILLLDDSTSSVDTQTEHLIQNALANLMQGRTTFIIAQRLSTVKRADLILVMDNGRIVERGTHSELLKKRGLYHQIYQLQLQDQEQFREDMELLCETKTEPAGDNRLMDIE